MACEKNEQRRPENCGGRGSRCPQYRGSPPEIISSGARGVSFFLDSPFNRTNILPRWGRGDRILGFLQTYCPAGAGGSGPGLLQTYCPAGAVVLDSPLNSQPSTFNSQTFNIQHSTFNQPPTRA